jgi:catechol 1,2-dioxygenase
MNDMSAKPEIADFVKTVAGLKDAGSPRLNQIVAKIVADLFDTIARFDVSEDEFWHALNYLAESAPEFGLWAAGLGFEHLLDLRMDEKDAQAGIPEGTPRTIEGPLYVAGAPLIESGGRIDDGTDVGETLIMHGQVRDIDGKPLAGAIVDVWHANTKGNYSTFDKSQSAYNMRRRVKTDEQGRYEFRSIMPSGYSVPPGSGIDRLLTSLGRHGNRPAHIHFFVTAPHHRHLTTQINIDGDPYLHDDFAYATRDGLIPPVVRHSDSASIHAAGLNAPYSEITFDFTLVPATQDADEALSSRARVMSA